MTAMPSPKPIASTPVRSGRVANDRSASRKIQAVKEIDDLVSAAEGSDELALFVKDVRNPDKDAQAVTLNKGEPKELARFV